MDRLFFTQNNEIAVDLHDIAAESAFKAQLESHRSKYPFTESRASYNLIRQIIRPDSLAAFNDLRDLLEAFVVKYPLTKIYQIR